jgi:hypothetical protein
MELLPLTPIESFSYEPEFESGNLGILQEQRKRDVQVRRRLLAFSLLLTAIAPFISYLYPLAWTYILATGVAFTIGTNLLISVVSTRVEDKADRVEERMVDLMDSLNVAADRLQIFHDQLESVNIPGVQQMLENVRDEVAPGLRSLDDVDIAHIATEIRRASRFVDTLDMDKVGTYLSHIRKEEGPYFDDYEDDDENEFWPEETILDTSNDLPDLSLVMRTQNDEQKRQNEILSRLIG